MEDLTREKFDKLSPKEQEHLAVKALAWFCVVEALNPFSAFASLEEFAVTKIILGKFRGGKG